MHHCLILALVLSMAACTVPLREAVVPVIPAPEVYTKPETDAINAEAQCKLMARNLVQIARCEPGRR